MVITRPKAETKRWSVIIRGRTIIHSGRAIGITDDRCSWRIGGLVLGHVKKDSLRNAVLRPHHMSGLENSALWELIGGCGSRLNHIIGRPKIVECAILVPEMLQ